MNFEYFIAHRMITGGTSEKNISSTIVKIAIIAVTLSVIVMLIAISTGTGLQKKIREKVSSLSGMVQLYKYNANQSEITISPIEIHQEFYPHWEGFNEKLHAYNPELTGYITHIQPIITKGGIIRTESTYEGIIAKGVGANYNWQHLGNFLKQGRFPVYKEGQMSTEILVSAYLAKRLNLEVGQRCNTLFLRDTGQGLPFERNFTVVGIYSSGFEQFDASYIFTDIAQLRRINQWQSNEVGAFEVFLNDFSQTHPITTAIYYNIPSEMDARNIMDKYPTIFEWFYTFDLNIIIIICVMILVGGINMITALLVLILERTPMIGNLKSMGATSWQIRKIFIFNAAYLIGISLLLGNVIGLGLLFLQEKFSIIKLDPSVYYVEEVAIDFNFWYILLLNVGVMLLCLLMLLLPSYVISRISPMQAMKIQ